MDERAKVIADLPVDQVEDAGRDLKQVRQVAGDRGAFPLEDKLDEMAPLVRDFLDRRVTQ